MISHVVPYQLFGEVQLGYNYCIYFVFKQAIKEIWEP